MVISVFRKLPQNQHVFRTSRKNRNRQRSIVSAIAPLVKRFLLCEKHYQYIVLSAFGRHKNYSLCCSLSPVPRPLASRLLENSSFVRLFAVIGVQPFFTISTMTGWRITSVCICLLQARSRPSARWAAPWGSRCWARSSPTSRTTS